MESRVFYHVWFSPKRRKWLLQGDVGAFVKERLSEVAQENGIGLLNSEVMVDHVHLLLALAPDEGLSWVLQLLKGVTARRVFQAFPELKLDANTDHFWQRGYGYGRVPQGAIRNVTGYISTQWNRLEKYDR